MERLLTKKPVGIATLSSNTTDEKPLALLTLNPAHLDWYTGNGVVVSPLDVYQLEKSG